jgi:proteic killer suppression protein
MIKSFANKGLEELFEKGKTARIGASFIGKCAIILTLLDGAETLDDLKISAYRFHSLNTKPVRYSMRVNKNYSITFEWDNGAVKVDFEDYH